MKLPAPAPAPSIAPVQSEIPPMGDESMPPVDMGAEQSEMGQPQDDDVNAFGKEKFDAGIDVDEDADPKKYIEKLTGKLAQKLRDYNGTEQDVDLNKFVVNSLIPAAVPQMDETDAKDVIKKVQDNIGKSGDVQGQESDDMGDDGMDIPDDNGMEQGEELPPVPQEESKVNEIDDLINEILGGKSVKRNVQRKNPFKTPKFK